MKNKNKNVKRFLVGCSLLLIIIIGIVCSKLIKPKNEEIVYKYESRVQQFKDFDAQGLEKIGWLQVQGVDIDVPIISSWFTGTPNYNYGWVVDKTLKYDTRKIIVGHNVLNVSSNPMIKNELFTNFESLMALSYYNVAKNNMYLTYSDEKEDKVYVIYAIGFYDYDSKYSDSGLNREEVSEYLKYVKQNSIYDYDVDVNKNDDIITIRTCTRMFGVDEKQQFQIDARLLRKNEKATKKKVDKTKLYSNFKLKDDYVPDKNFN